MKTTTHCTHYHKITVSDIEPFLEPAPYRTGRDIMVDSVTIKFDDGDTIDKASVVSGHGFYTKSDGSAGLRRAASYSGARIKIANLPEGVQVALMEAIRDSAH